MVVWKGMGVLVLVITILFIYGIRAGVEGLLGEGYSVQYDWPFGLSLVISGVIVWFLGKYLNSKNDGKVLVDKEDGTEYKMGVQHSLFFLRFEYWGPILAIGGLVIALLP